MKRIFNGGAIAIVVIVSLSLVQCKSSGDPGTTDRDRLFNTGWKFMRDSLSGAEQPEYDDSQWITVDLPHDWSIADLPGEDGPDQIGPFSKESPGGRRSTGHVIGGTGWYRKHFTLDKEDEGKIAVLRFDGVYMEAEVWINGSQAGVHKYGYTPFWFDITSLLNPPGEPNVIAVKVDNIGRNTRWYSGSGIYRNVYLTLTRPLHVAVWGVYVTTPEVSEDSAVVDVAVTVRNDGNSPATADLRIRISDPGGRTVGEAETSTLLDTEYDETVKARITVENPDLWSVESPDMYRVGITMETNDETVDEYTQPFGIRSIDFSAEKGFLLNGKPVELRGGSLHHDNGLLGSAAIDRAEERRVEIMKAGGYNAIRCSHNPPSEAFLDACDRNGMLVIDEFSDIWEAPKNPQDYSRFFKTWWKKDQTDMVLRDRNHPCIIMWSIGNEILEKNDTSGLRIGKQLAGRFRELDPARPVTEAVNDNWRRRGLEWDSTAAAFALLDVGGYNYEWKWMESDHEKYPDRIMYGSESFPLEAYDYWQPVEKYPYVIGDFVWTGMDYLGEAAIGRSGYVSADQQNNRRRGGGMPPSGGAPQFGGMPPSGGAPAQAPSSGGPVPDMAAAGPFGSGSEWPAWFGAWCGDIDITGREKPQKLYRDVLWDISKLEINVHAPIPEGQTERVSMWGWPDEWPSWTWKGNEGKALQVRVFTKGDRVRLELNGNVVGERTLSEGDEYIASFEVPYEPGELRAVAFEKGSEIATKSLKTAGDPAGIRLVADRDVINADRNDLSFVTIEAIDENGQVVPDDSIRIKLSLTVNGEIAASGNASPYDMESVNKPVIKTFKGRAQAIIRPYETPGKISLKAEAEGLEPGELVIKSRSR